MMTPEALVARAMLAAVKRKVGITFIDLKSDRGKLSYIPRAKYGIKPIFVAFGADNARTIIDNMAPDDWASFYEVNPWL
ncbi:MAG: hypothetical protein KIG72_08185 [Bradymonadales bacterium]|nr:hypothetical protein [Bradymonadales bacterium]